MQLLAHLLFWFGTHAIYCMPVVVLFIPAAVLGLQRWPRLQRVLVSTVVALAVLTFISIFVGSALASRLVYAAGEDGRGEVVSTYGTSTQVNSHNVVGYRVLLRTRTGQTVQTAFEDNYFNVYPPANSVRYPGVGDQFTARYLPAYPQDFVIITNDNSPYAHKMSCDVLLDSLHEARRVHEFDLGNATSKQAYVALIGRVLARHCYTDSTDRREYYGDLAHVQLEPCQRLLDSLDVLRTRYNANIADLANDQAYLALIRRVIAHPACYTDSADLRKYYDDIRRVEKAEAGVQAAR